MKKILIFLTPFLFTGCMSFLPYQTDFTFDNTARGTADVNAIENHNDSMLEAGENDRNYPIVKGIYEKKLEDKEVAFKSLEEDLKECGKKLKQCNKITIEDITK